MAEARKAAPLGQFKAVSKAAARKASMTEKNLKIKTQEEAFSLRHGKFVTDGGVQEFVYIPATDASEISAKSGELFESILRHWNLQRPHLLIKFQSGFAHPKRLMDEKEMDKLANNDFNSEIYQYYEYFRGCVDNDSDLTEAIEKKRKKLEEEKDKLEKQKAQNQKTLDTHQGTAASSPKGAGEDGRQKETQFLSEDEGKEDEDKNNAGAQRKSQESKTSYDRLEALKDELKNLDTQLRKEKTLALLNDFLYGSLSNLIDVIVRACVRNRCWILVEGGPNGGLLLLKQAAERCLEKPTILVMDSLKKSRYPYEDVRKFVEADDEGGKDLRQKLEMNGHLMSELVLKGPADKNQVKIIADRMAAQTIQKKKTEEEKARTAEGEAMEKASVKSFGCRVGVSGASRGEKSKKEQREWTLEDQQEVDAIRVESALMTARLLENTQPINQPVVAPMKLGRNFWDMDSEQKGWTCKTAKDPEAGKVRWNQWHFRGGTHYILCDDHHHALVLHSLAPSGCIFLGGGDSSKKELLKMLVNGHPVVCLNNTGRLTQEFVRCHDFLCTELFRMAKRDEDASSTRNAAKGAMLKRSPRSELLQVPKKEKSDYLKDNIKKKSVFKTLTFDGDLGILERRGLVFNMQQKLKEVTEFTQPELCELFLTYLRRGLQITKLCVVMDPLNPRECSGGHTEDKLSMCLSNFVILASNDTSDFADVEAVKAASELQWQLEIAAAVERRWAISMVYLLALLNLLSLLLALAEKGSGAMSYMPWLPESILDWGLPAVSAVSTFISGLIARFRFTLRWSKAQSAASHLEAEIWKFRTRVSDYTVVGGSSTSDVNEATRFAVHSDLETDDAGRKGEEHAFTRERKQDETRNLFRSNVTNIFNSAMEEMGTSSLHNGGNDKLPSRQKAQLRRYGPQESRWQRVRRYFRPKKPASDEEEPPDTESGNLAPDQEDLTMYGHIGIDDYYRQRTLDVLERMKNQAFWLTFKQGGLESFVLLFGTAGVLLSTFGQTEVAMITVSLAASLQSLVLIFYIRFHALSTRLDAANAGERDMICAWQDWSAMEPMQRRFQTNVSRLVLTTEGVNVALTSAATAGVRQSLAKKPS
eukprot:s156_g5.t1